MKNGQARDGTSRGEEVNPRFEDWKWFHEDNGGANFPWVQRFIPHLALHGMSGWLRANCSMFSNRFVESDLRRVHINSPERIATSNSPANSHDWSQQFTE